MGLCHRFHWRTTGAHFPALYLYGLAYIFDRQHSHAAQHVMSKELTPVLAGAVPTFERFMSRWERLSLAQPHLAPAINAGLEVAYKYYKQMDNTTAYIIAMCMCLFIICMCYALKLRIQSYIPQFECPGLGNTGTKFL